MCFYPRWEEDTGPGTNHRHQRKGTTWRLPGKTLQRHAWAQEALPWVPRKDVPPGLSWWCCIEPFGESPCISRCSTSISLTHSGWGSFGAPCHPQWFVITLRMKPICFPRSPFPECVGFCLCFSLCSVHSLTNTAQLQGSPSVPWCSRHVFCLNLLPFLPPVCHATWVALLSIDPSSPVDISKDAAPPNSPFGVVSLQKANLSRSLFFHRLFC